MVFIPDFAFSLFNGWLPFAGYLVLFGVLIAIFPKEVVRRLYDRSMWTRKQKIITVIGKLFTLCNLVIVIMSPMNIDGPLFIIGSVLWAFGLIGMSIALINYRNTPLDVPVTRGFYRISRNPQIFSIGVVFLGIILMIASGISLLLMAVSFIFLHTSTLAEEKACLEQYGQSYRDFMNSVPRYFLFF